MKIVRYKADNDISFGALEGDDTVRRLEGNPLEGINATEVIYTLNQVQLLAPIEPPRVFGVGLNYLSHIRESGQQAPAFPILFMKPPTAVIGPEAPIVYPQQGTEVHYEGELAVVIGRKARRVSQQEALDCVFGYTCGNDVSERTIQSAEMKTGCLLIGKGFDTFCPLGPIIVTDLDPSSLELATRVNGQERQHVNTSDLLFTVDKLIAYISEAVTLLPGDVILTGTPSGVGPVTPGDLIEIEISGIGVLKNPVVVEA
jgi:2-keto-4-pentenoate hydratase/2-oxohepta-3-ene-1,7-dioic acid hydratase in catechol pathway